MKILVVDDSRFNLKIAERLLKENKRVSDIILCEKPENAMRIINDKNIDILILDIIMPEISGFELMQMIRQDKKYDDMPIIMFTSLNDAESFSRCFDLGASDYISKPINEIEFNARIKAAIDTRMASNHMKDLLKVTKEQNRELKEMNVKLSETKFHLVQSEKMAAIGQLAAGIAHEINNPMGFVNSNFEILEKYLRRISEYINFVNSQLVKSNKLYLEKEIFEKYKELKIEIIVKELEGIITDSKSGIMRVTEIVQSLRSFARTVKDDEKDVYSVLDIINQVLLICKNEIKYVADIEIDVPDEVSVYCNKLQIGQVLINILVNAAQAIKSQNKEQMGLVRIKADKSDGYINLYVEDDGPGISEEHKQKIFEPFFTTKEIGSGTGLGLSISYDIIVNKHSGLIDVVSEQGKGTKFIVKLPEKLNLN
ncbi:response regulator [Anaerosacchariphilus polymeriproducens]|uniref:Stage 0 sporulation protein A homolog n=1 Tax=Anaerosacchariphilus polymeriproducens TaxID=1812858 RepID=A0A371ASP5_9FIRM|nr:response regulator [Anaerosacchariphilus polymeriproducens]RDU22569.1 hybrid sensor histidine kinase/response regulator [Anaerosacchariphilus polymeriproducens]